MATNQPNILPAYSNTQTSTNNSDLNHWQRLTTFIDANPQFNLGQVRWLIRNRSNNGLDSCIKKIGRSYYIHDQLFSQWISNKV